MRIISLLFSFQFYSMDIEKINAIEMDAVIGNYRGKLHQQKDVC
jgi:hypothetical protein